MPKKKKLVGGEEELKPIELPEEEDDKVLPLPIEDDLGLAEDDLDDEDDEEEAEEGEEF